MAIGFVIVPRGPSAQTSAVAPSVSCESLAKVALPNATITSAEAVAAGFTPPAGRGGRGRSGAVGAAAAVLSRGGDDARHAVRHQGGSVAAARVERSTARSGQRGVGRLDQLRRLEYCAVGGFCDRQHRYWPHGGQSEFRDRAAGGGYRLRLPSRPRDDAQGQAPHLVGTMGGRRNSRTGMAVQLAASRA